MLYEVITGLMPYVATPDDLTDAKIAFTDEGGIAIKLTNKTGAATVKGTVVTPGTADNAVIKVPVDVPNPIGVFYEDDVAADAEAWVVISGIAVITSYSIHYTKLYDLFSGYLP